MLMVGLFIIPLVIYLLIEGKDYKTSIKKRRLIDISLLLISICFIIITFMVNTEPFKFQIASADDYIIYSLIILIFTPFLWIVLGHFILNYSKSLRFKKNAKAKSKTEYMYYRDSLDKLSPGLVMYVRNLDISIKEAIASSILKLKLNKNIEETKNKFNIIDDKGLLRSEKMIISLINDKSFDEKKYIEVVRKEAYEKGYIKSNFKNIYFRIIKIILLILLPIFVIITSFKFDKYVFSNYKAYIKDGQRYVLIKDEIGDIRFDHPDNFEDFYHGNIRELGNKEFYDASLIKANKYSNEHVRKTVIYQKLDALYITFGILLAFVCIYLIIEQLIYINKNEKRTVKGVDLINKSYALKNFLKDFSDIKNRKAEEIVLWEYYLVYAVALGVNEKINDKLIEKYTK